jgi:hypothetical protein
MSFNLSEFKHIISTIDDLLSMSDPQSFLNIAMDCEDSEEDENAQLFIKLVFSLKNGNSEMRLYDATGVFHYRDLNGETLKSIWFDDSNITLTDGTFKKSLKQIRSFDRQHVNHPTIAHTPIDRASFGLAEVN